MTIKLNQIEPKELKCQCSFWLHSLTPFIDMTQHWSLKHLALALMTVSVFCRSPSFGGDLPGNYQPVFRTKKINVSG